MKKISLLLLLILSECLLADSLSLSPAEAIRKAEEHSFSIKAARHDSLSAESNYGAARALRYPSLSLNSSATYLSKTQSADLTIRKIEIGSKENYQADAKVVMPLFTGGRISSQIQFQKKVLDMRSVQLEIERLRNAYLTRKAYLKLMAAQFLLNAAQASFDRVTVISQDVQNLHAAGLADSLDLLDAKLSSQKSAQLVEEKKTATQNASTALSQLLGLDDLVVPVEKVPIPATDFGEASDSLQRPELTLSGLNIELAEVSHNLKKAEYFPVLSGYGGYNVGKPNRDLFNKTWNDYFSTGLSLSWEFNLGGKSIQSAKAAEQNVAAAQSQRNNLEESLRLQVKVAAENLKLALKSHQLAQLEQETAGQKYRLGKEKYDAGQLSTNRLLELQDEVTTAEQYYQAALINVYLAETEYLYAIGSPAIFGGL